MKVCSYSHVVLGPVINSTSFWKQWKQSVVKVGCEDVLYRTVTATEQKSDKVWVQARLLWLNVVSCLSLSLNLHYECSLRTQDHSLESVISR